MFDEYLGNLEKKIRWLYSCISLGNGNEEVIMKGTNG